MPSPLHSLAWRENIGERKAFFWGTRTLAKSQAPLLAKTIFLRALIGCLFTIIASSTHATAFDGIKWLPDPGLAPDHIGYPLDRTEERLRLFFMKDGDRKLDECMNFAREKLSEIQVLVLAGKAGLAWVSAGLYIDYVDRATRTINSAASKGILREANETRLRFASMLLEDTYIITQEYPKLPLDIREFAFARVLNKAMMTLEIQRNMLPAKYQVQISDRLSIVRQGVLNVREADRRKIVLQTP